MIVNDLIETKRKQLSELGFIQFNQSELEKLDSRQMNKIEQTFQGHGVMKLPEQEIQFFVWVKQHDQDVWNDLWDTDDEPYLVSIEFLHHFSSDGNGFPICDLENVENFWFSQKHIKPNGKLKFEIINNKIENNEKLNLEELLLYEIVQNPIDIWHFSHRYKVPLDKVKAKILEMNSNDVLVHLPNRDDLLKYIDF
ncbi:hypothetical protein ACFLSX_05085 [Calditrichota bacterium]